MGERWLLIVNILIVISLVGLYAYKENIEPIRTNVENCGKYVGEYVEVRGIVIKSTISIKSTFFTITDDFVHRVYAITAFHATIYPGASVIIRGVVREYHNLPEITVESQENLKIVEKRYPISLPVLLENPERYSGMHVTFFAMVKNPKIIYLNLTDRYGYVHGFVSGYYGERAGCFHGRVKNGSFIVEYVSSKCTPGYTNTTTEDIMRHEGSKVCIHARIYGFGVKFYATDENYSITVYDEYTKIPSGYIRISGVFIYEAHTARYVIYGEKD